MAVPLIQAPVIAQQRPIDQPASSANFGAQSGPNYAYQLPMDAGAPRRSSPSNPPTKSASKQRRANGLGKYASFLVSVDQSTNWPTNSPGISNTWINLGLTGVLGKDKLFVWAVTGGPTFQASALPNSYATNWRYDLYGSLSPLKGDEINVYANLRSITGENTNGNLRSLNAGIITSLMKSKIFPDVFELINLPDRGLYVRAQNRSAWNGPGVYTASYTDLYAGWAESWSPFSFAVEAGPQLVQTYPRGRPTPLRTYLGATINVKYFLSRRTEMFLEYRPSTSFGNQYGGANQLLRGGIGFKF